MKILSLVTPPVLLVWGAVLSVPLPGALAEESVHADLPAAVDTWVDQAGPNASHSGETSLVARFEDASGSRILIGFDFGDLEGARIDNAVLRLTMLQSAGEEEVALAAAGIQEQWDESVTWEDQPRRTQTLALVRVGSTPGEVAWEATHLLKETLEATGTLFGIALSGPVAGDPPTYVRTFASSRADEAPPILSVDYVPGAASTETPDPDDAPSATGPPDVSDDRPLWGKIAILGALVLLGAVAIGAFARSRVSSKSKPGGEP